MNNIYEKILSLRDNISSTDQKARDKVDFLSKLMIVAFENNDVLPDSFYLQKVFVNEDEAKSLLIALGIASEVTIKNDSFIGGKLLKININK